MRRLLLAALFAFPVAARAQLPGHNTPIAPPMLQGCATMSVTTSSAQITAGNVTLCPNSRFPTSSVQLYVNVQNNSASPVYLCPLGGTCTTVGMYIAVGQGVTKSLNWLVQVPSVVSTGTATIYLEW